MKKKRQPIKLNFLYYLSVVDIAVTNFMFHVIHMVTKGKRPVMMSKEMQKDLERLIQESRKETHSKKAPAGEPEPRAKEL